MFTVPQKILYITETLRKGGFEAYLVGGCVRDLVRGEKPKDWDITTNAKPEDIQKLFPNTFYENDFGTVGIVSENVSDESLKVVEVTPYRLEAAYTDKRRPDKVEFAGTLEDDLKRRDFTVNAMAYDDAKKELIDPHRGQNDIKEKIIRAVGDPHARLSEDALRMMRAVRLAAELGFSLDAKTGEAMKKNAMHLARIAVERVREEFHKTIMSKHAMRGISLFHEHGLLTHVVSELEEGIGCEQNGDHIYDVWEHNLRALQHAADSGWLCAVRLAALFHDVAKPETRRWSKEKNDWTFYGHDVVGGRKTKSILKRMRYGNDITEKVSKLVRWHLFFSDIDTITLSAVRRLVRNVGPENVWDLMKVRACDRIGMGRPKEKPYRLRKYESMIEEAVRAPVSVKMLKINGDTIMEITGEKPSARIGFILHALLEEVLDDPDRNNEAYLRKRAHELSELSEEALKDIGKRGKKKKDEEEEKVIKEIRGRHWVK